MNPIDEIRHIRNGPAPGEAVPGNGTVTFKAESRTGRAAAHLALAKDALVAVLQCGPDASEAAVVQALPPMFAARFRPEPTREEADAWLARWRAADRAQQVRMSKERGWDLPGWLYWFDPDNRAWWWWNSWVESDHVAMVQIVVEGWPYPWKALEALLLNAGFDGVSEVDP